MENDCFISNFVKHDNRGNLLVLFILKNYYLDNQDFALCDINFECQMIKHSLNRRIQ